MLLCRKEACMHQCASPARAGVCVCVSNSVPKSLTVLYRRHGATVRAVPTKLRTVVEALRDA